MRTPHNGRWMVSTIVPKQTVVLDTPFQLPYQKPFVASLRRDQSTQWDPIGLEISEALQQGRRELDQFSEPSLLEARKLHSIAEGVRISLEPQFVQFVSPLQTYRQVRVPSDKIAR